MYGIVYPNKRNIHNPHNMLFNKKYRKYWNTFGAIVAILVGVSMVLLYSAPSLF